MKFYVQTQVDPALPALTDTWSKTSPDTALTLGSKLASTTDTVVASNGSRKNVHET